MAALYARLASETGVSILYVDEMASRYGNLCYAAQHGHPVPSDLNASDYHFLKAVRESTPGHVALYGEYPPSDAAAQFLDGVIHYYFHDESELLFSPTYDNSAAPGPVTSVGLNLYRFMFPRLMHLDLPIIGHGSWHSLKFTFFNGEAIYKSFWKRDESRAHTFMARAQALKRAWKDCFTSDEPEMLVPTLRTGVYANRFPGKGRTLWTLYNARFTTVRGPVLGVAHVPGARYFDAWNDRELDPEIHGDRACLALELDPQNIGCVTQVLHG